MMSFRSSIIIVAIVSFSLTFGIGLWQRKRAELPMPTPDTAPGMAGMHASTDPQATANIRPTAPNVAPPLSSAEGPRSVIAESRADLQSPEEGSEMPVQLGFNHRAKDQKLVARVFSSANYPLVVGVQIGSDSRGTIDCQITIPPNGTVILGGDDGLDLQSGDRVTLLSHPYADKVSQAP